MSNCIIKICGICDPIIAEKTAKLGANFIGIIFHSASPRFVNLHTAALISKAVKKAGALPVAIFVNHTNDDMQTICEATDIQIAQLHGDIARAYCHLLPTQYTKIYVKHISDQGELESDHKLKYLDPDRDFILIDHQNPGLGNQINCLKLNYNLPFKWILAGGLTPLNIATKIHDLRPNGIDVSSSVESSRGNKDILLIQEFIAAVRGYHAK